MKIDISPINHLSKRIEVPSSKSVSARALILAAQKKHPVLIRNISNSTDVETLIDNLSQVGLELERNGNDIRVLNSFPECEKEGAILNSGDGGTTNRFLLSLLSKGQCEYKINLQGPMKKRPMAELLRVLRECQVKVDQSDETITIKGPARAPLKPLRINCSQSTQFASSLLLCFDYDFEFESLSSSRGYLEMTKKMVQEFDNEIYDYAIPTDMSSLSYPLALGAIRGEIGIRNLYYDEQQPDSFLYQEINKWGGLSLDKTTLEINKCQLPKSLELDCALFPDLVPTLVFIATELEERSTFKNLEVLEHKECNRFRELQNILKVFEIPYEVYNFDLMVYPKNKNITSKTYHAPADHRMIMLAALLMACNGGGTIYNHEHINKSYSSFFDLLN